MSSPFDFYSTTFENVKFQHNEAFNKANFQFSTFKKIKFAGTSFKNANFKNAKFIDCDLNGGNFSGSNFAMAKFINTQTKGANFAEAFLNGSDLSQTKENYSSEDEIFIGHSYLICGQKDSVN